MIRLVGGWRRVCRHDLKSLQGQCQMCKRRGLRFIHIMQRGPRTLCVGWRCAKRIGGKHA